MRIPEAQARADVEEAFVHELKFASWLPDALKPDTAAARLIDRAAALAIATLPMAISRQA